MSALYHNIINESTGEDTSKRLSASCSIFIVFKRGVNICWAICLAKACGFLLDFGSL